MALAICTAATASACAVAGLASATTLAPTKAKVAELSAGQLAAARRAHSLVVAYDAELSTVALLRSQVTAAEGTVAALRSAYRSTSLLLQQEAVLFYVDAVPTEAPAGEAAQADEFVSQIDEATYERLAVGNLSGTLDRFRQEEAGIKLALHTYNQDLSRDLAAARLLASRRRQALAQAVSLEEMLTRARTELAAEAVKHRATAGPPVGSGIVAAIASQLGGAPPTARPFAHANAIVSSARSAPSAPNVEATGLRLRTTTSVLAPAEAPTTTSVPKATTTRPTTTTTVATTTTAPTTTTTSPATTTPSTTSPPATTAPTTTVATTTTAPATTTHPPATPSTTSATTKAATATSTTAAPAKTSTSSVTAPSSTPARSASSSTTSTAGASPSTTGGSASSTGGSTSSTGSTASTGGSSSTGGHPPPAGGVWLELRQCESGDNYQENTGNGFYGAYQFAWSTWTELGYSGRPDQAPYWVQDEAAQKLEAMEGWSPWPACSAALGL